MHSRSDEIILFNFFRIEVAFEITIEEKDEEDDNIADRKNHKQNAIGLDSL